MGYEQGPVGELVPPTSSDALVEAWYRMQVQNAHLLQRLAVQHELNPIDLRALKFLGVDDVPRTPKQLAEFLEAGSSLVSAMIDRLEARLFIRRMPNPNDRRSTLLLLEPRGRGVTQQLRGMYRQALVGLLVHADQDMIVSAADEVGRGLRAATLMRSAA